MYACDIGNFVSYQYKEAEMTVKEGDGEKQERKLRLVILQSHGDDKRGILILFVVHVLCHRISIEDPFIPAIDGRLDTLICHLIRLFAQQKSRRTNLFL